MHTYIDLRSNETPFELACLSRPIFAALPVVLGIPLAAGLLSSSGVDPRARPDDPAKVAFRATLGALSDPKPGAFDEFMVKLSRAVRPCVRGQRLNVAGLATCNLVGVRGDLEPRASATRGVDAWTQSRCECGAQTKIVQGWPKLRDLARHFD